MTESPDCNPFTCPPAAGRGQRSRTGKMRLSDSPSRRPHPDADVLKELCCGTAAEPDAGLNRHTLKQSSPMQTPQKNGKASSRKQVDQRVDLKVHESGDDAESDGRNGRTTKRPAGGRGRGRRNVPDMTLVRSSSRKKIKKSLGEDFLDPRELNSQMKHKVSNASKPIADVEKSHHTEIRMRCSKCNQMRERNEGDERIAGHSSNKSLTSQSSIGRHIDSEMLSDSNGAQNKWMCLPCQETDDRICSVCGDIGSEVLCSSCDPSDSMSVHRKCITNVTPHYDYEKWQCEGCDQHHESLVEVDKGSNEESCLTEVTTVASDSLVDKNPEQPVLTEIKPNTESVSGPEIIAVDSEVKEEKPLSKRKPETWSVADVVSFIESTGYQKEAIKFKDQEIDGKSLLLMKRNDVITGLGLKVGVGLKLFSFINHLQTLKLVTQQSPALSN